LLRCGRKLTRRIAAHGTTSRATAAAALDGQWRTALLCLWRAARRRSSAGGDAIEAAITAEREAGHRRHQLRESLARDIEAARYEADRTFRQYDAADPANRPASWKGAGTRHFRAYRRSKARVQLSMAGHGASLRPTVSELACWLLAERKSLLKRLLGQVPVFLFYWTIAGDGPVLRVAAASAVGPMTDFTQPRSRRRQDELGGKGENEIRHLAAGWNAALPPAGEAARPLAIRRATTRNAR